MCVCVCARAKVAFIECYPTVQVCCLAPLFPVSNLAREWHNHGICFKWPGQGLTSGYLVIRNRCIHGNGLLVGCVYFNFFF